MLIQPNDTTGRFDAASWNSLSRLLGAEAIQRRAIFGIV